MELGLVKTARGHSASLSSFGNNGPGVRGVLPVFLSVLFYYQKDSISSSHSFRLMGERNFVGLF